jgi:hypothetical protein|tara:strand:+ start:726 stop:1019 length:294 start_codon:yes stop_codon:yes gene_type:complete
MAGIINASIDVSKLPKEKFFKGKKGVYYNFTITVNDESNQFGQNVTITDSQTKEEREAKKPKNYLGNGEVVWTNNILNKVEKNVAVVETAPSEDLPF